MNTDWFQSIDREMKRGLESKIYTGAVLLVSKDDETLFHEPYGTLGGAGTSLVTRHTLFDLASLTKILATTPCWIVLSSAHPHLLDRSIREWYPHCPRLKEGITPRLLLAHASGLPAWRPYYLFAQSQAPMKAFVEQRILSETLQHGPGDGTLYSDLGFMLLGFILESETGQSLESLSRDVLYEPLSVRSDLLFNVGDAEMRTCVTRTGEPPGLVNDLNARSLGGRAGHAGLFGTAEAVIRVAREISRSFDGESGFFDTEMVTRFCSRFRSGMDCSRGLGFDAVSGENPAAGQYFSGQSIGHTGFTGTSLWIDLERRIVVTLLTNRVIMGEADKRIQSFRPRVHNLVMKGLTCGSPHGTVRRPVRNFS